jgi:cbb3-type cytochrome oxidase maturation protein
MTTLATLLEEASKYVPPATLEESDDTITITLYMIVMAGLVGISTWLFFLWAVKDKQFDEPEEIAHRMNDIDERVHTLPDEVKAEPAAPRA